MIPLRGINVAGSEGGRLEPSIEGAGPETERRRNAFGRGVAGLWTGQASSSIGRDRRGQAERLWGDLDGGSRSRRFCAICHPRRAGRQG